MDPIDGTVNFAYGIPHACVSIALQQRAETPKAADFEDGYLTLAGIVYDPFCGELWTGLRGQAARLNGKPIRVSQRRHLREAVVSRDELDRLWAAKKAEMSAEGAPASAPLLMALLIDLHARATTSISMRSWPGMRPCWKREP